MAPSPRLPDLTLADAGRTFVMRPGSARMLVLPGAAETGSSDASGGEDGERPHSDDPVSDGPVSLLAQPVRGGHQSDLRRYRLEALCPGIATIRHGSASWQIEVRGPARPAAQSRDDTDEGWGEVRSGIPRSWWEEQRPPHW